MIKTAKKKSKISFAFIVLSLCKRSYKGKNVAVLCPMSVMVQVVGIKTSLSANRYDGVLYSP